MSKNVDVLKSWIGGGSDDSELIRIKQKALQNNELYKPETSLGGGDLKEAIMSSVNTSHVEQENLKSVQSIKDSLVSFRSMYESKQGRLRKIFQLCIIAIAVAVLLIGVGLILSYVLSKTETDIIGKVTTASSILPALLSGTAFHFYSKIQKETEQIENEIIRGNKLLLFYSMVELVPDGESQDKAYADFVDILKSSMG